MRLTRKALQEFIHELPKLHSRPPVWFVLHNGLLERRTFFQPHAFVDDGRKDEVAIGFPEYVLELGREFRRSPLHKVEHDSHNTQRLIDSTVSNSRKASNPSNDADIAVGFS